MPNEQIERGRDGGKEKVKKQKRPKLFGRCIRHKWDDAWYEGTVIAVYGEDECPIDCEFDGFPDEYEVNLTEYWKNNWVVVCGSARKKKKSEKRKKTVEGEEIGRDQRPLFFGKRISYLWKEGWYKREVTAVFGYNELDTDCEFEMEYDGFEDRNLVELIEDWKEGKVKIIEEEDGFMSEQPEGSEKTERNKRQSDSSEKAEKKK